MITKEQAVHELIDWHFQSDPDIVEVYRFITSNEKEEREPIKLLEVTPETLRTGRVDTFSFRGTEEIPYAIVIAIIAPEEMEQIRLGQMLLPRGWDLASAQQLTPHAPALAAAGR